MNNIIELRLPSSVPFPVHITGIAIKEGDELGKHNTVLKYKYSEFRDVTEDRNEYDEDYSYKPPKKEKLELIGSYECPVDGIVKDVLVSIGDVVENKESVIATVIEPCSHSVQYGGLCALCGSAVEGNDYTGFSYDKQAPVVMSHGSADLKISLTEAEKIEQTSSKRLLKEKKLSLVVDLDQTVIHATVDPTVGEWMKDPNNANYPAVKDVRSFSLKEEVILPENYVGQKPPATVCWYYVKLRPHLREFLEHVSERYELHIYTMATRQYAKEIAKIIDPDEKYFGDRILSRDESGSLTQKSLQRLFPVDTSMVVVIDDRGDVWNWSSNLIKVVPYDFFVGIGDINSSFLPRQHALLGPSKRRKSLASLEDQINAEKDLRDQSFQIDPEEQDKELSEELVVSDENISDSSKENGEERGDSKETASTVDALLTMNDANGKTLREQSTEHNLEIEQQQSERPLAKLQENLEKIVQTESDHESANLLFDDDNELETLEQALIRIHNEFYFEYDDSKVGNPDVKDILNSMKQLVFKEYTFLLSGILPLGTKLNSADIVIWARSFGATVVADYDKSVTHVITRNTGTFKVKLAKTLDPNVKIVDPNWLFKCISFWDKVDEDEYLLEVPEDYLLPDHIVEKYVNENNIEKGQDGNDASFDLNVDDMQWIDKELEDFLSGDEIDDDEDDNDDDEANGTKKRHAEAGIADDEDTSKRLKLDEEETDSSEDELAKEIMLDMEKE
ncbi:Carboxy-terminal domain (CTD) phosphatase [Komagataella phaffii CBS 7435]|uniref:RNA polymerase II subunit A C-terminal domain phosphatase n=2 Tax=Komagataella phaffii TaxID=460519 RepID=C4R0N6_KOMPG|nr:uncharacterized protein PAS_chr2-1_0845 [Komagataella phaffii GS115]AOA62841.1 GQ67_00478T0 [Komagataella phaffii]CAH2448421.1 Carboxy-terminal domain (CTD) phosphatase [Komagataella phaffii CBS 7435]AOA67609.1 GQ68_00911T0 [Komagataella phaffii GS115]CAY69060.1 hypothetical protein PAS_chr2-1_0845 [Komagataella phaffii GS115]CCA38544.1 Carboxy-terminal domain (CTD) phosphatase [Komagataella phaffii CBS 7435]